ncbi:MAG TPA: glycosyltransferase family 2 protein [Chitinophagaceae bacterium]|jgi:glycosyltransferase involved in cell wall biosynthesis|nr:glycosyltransferase family 2 protein [Chitinophagaceae bacterium]
MDISVVIPLFNERDSLPELCSWITRVMDENGLSYEVILVDDGSTDDSWAYIEEKSSLSPCFKGIRFQRNYGKSAALNEGFRVADGSVVITMDSDLQDSPDEIPDLYRMIIQDGYDMVSGWKKKRHDPIGKTIPSKFFNWVTKKSTGIKLHDFNCGLKAYRKNVIKSIEVYGEMHRYIPVIAKWSGFRKIGEKIVEHRPRQYGVSKFGLERFINGFLDLMSIMFVGRFGKKPMHFFGTLGTLVFFIGFCIWIYLGIAKFFFQVYKMTERPIFFLAIVAIIVGSQLFLTGFLAELITRNAPERNHYLVEKTTGF